ncbi:MAG: HAMP domain-containing protein [Pseudomonadota bacterium]
MTGKHLLRVERLSIRGVTVAIIVMVGVVATILSLLAGGYFRRAALDAQADSLSRVIEVAAQEVLKAVRGHTFELGMRLGHSPELLDAVRGLDAPGGRERLAALLDDPFVNGFVGFASVNLEKIRVHDLKLRFLAESGRGIAGLERTLAPSLAATVARRSGVERLKAADALWLSSKGPLHSTLVPIGGLHPLGYLEIVVDPAYNLPEIGAITRTPISIHTPDGRPIVVGAREQPDRHLPVEYTLLAADGRPAFRIVGHEDVARLDARMERTRWVTVGGFLLLTVATLLVALWLFNRFLFLPARRLAGDMERMAAGELDLRVDDTGLRDFAVLARTFNAMTEQVRMRTRDLERLLDLDDSAILCFGGEGEALYFNRGALALLGYTAGEIGDLDLGDVFVDDLGALLRQAEATAEGKPRVRLACLRKDGARVERDAVVRTLDAREGRGHVVVLDADGAAQPAEALVNGLQRHEQRMHAVEQSLNSLLEMARAAPGFLSAPTAAELLGGEAETGAARASLREQAVQVMLCALACWERDLGRSKLDLAEASQIWPVYIDKSTPTTRTLDKYLNLDTCPRNPRTQRVIDTAEFVLRQMGRKGSDERTRLQDALAELRRLVAGMKATE